MFCKRSSTTCPLCRYTNAQLLRHDDSLELNLFPGAYVTHLSKHFSVSLATTSLKTALRFSSCERDRAQKNANGRASVTREDETNATMRARM